MASVVPTLSASELDQILEDAKLWYEKVRTGEQLQPDELARLHSNTKHLMDHVCFLEQHLTGDVPTHLITRTEMDQLRENVCRSGARPSPIFLDYTELLRGHIDELDKRLCGPTLLRPPFSRLGVQSVHEQLEECCAVGSSPLTGRETQLCGIARKLLAQVDCLTEELERVCRLREVGMSIQSKKLAESRERSEGLQKMNEAMSQLILLTKAVV